MPERGRSMSDPDLRGGRRNAMLPAAEAVPSVGVGGRESKYDELVRSAHCDKLMRGEAGPIKLVRDCVRKGEKSPGDAENVALGDAKNVAGDGGTENEKSHDGAPLIMDEEVDMRRISWR